MSNHDNVDGHDDLSDLKSTQQPDERTVSLKECQEVATAEYRKFGRGVLHVTEALLKHLGIKYVD